MEHDLQQQTSKWKCKNDLKFSVHTSQNTSSILAEVIKILMNIYMHIPFCGGEAHAFTAKEKQLLPSNILSFSSYIQKRTAISILKKWGRGEGVIWSVLLIMQCCKNMQQLVHWCQKIIIIILLYRRRWEGTWATYIKEKNVAKRQDKHFAGPSVGF